MKIRSFAFVGSLFLMLVLAGFVSSCGGGPGSAADALSAITPTDGATGIPVTQVITASFNADLDETTLTATTIKLTRAADAINVAGAIAYDAASRTLTFTPDVPLFAGTLYTFTMTSGAHTKAAGDLRISFTTQEVPILFLSSEGLATSPVDLWTMNADGSDKTNLTSFGTKAAGSVNFGAAWSPDLTRVAFLATTNDPEDRSNLYVMNADGSNRIDLTGGGAHYMVQIFKWAPDGSKIFFQYTADSSGANDSYNIGSVNPDGTELMNLTNLASTQTVQTPVWEVSPDGTVIYYCAGGFGMDDPYDLYSIGTDGSSNTKLTEMPTGQKAVYQRLSPDGATLYYTAGSSLTGIGLYARSVSTGEQRTLVEPELSRPVITWDVSPDGSRLLTSFITGGKNDLYIIHADGSDTTQLTTAAGSSQAVIGNWSPDGAQVAYLYGDTGAGPLDLFVASRDGTGATNLTNYSADSYAFDGALYIFGFNAGIFSPDGTRFLFNQKVVTGGHDELNVMMANVDGSGITAVTSMTTPAGAGAIGWW